MSARHRCDISSNGAVLPGRNDADMGPANSLHASAYYSEYYERFDLISSKLFLWHLSRRIVRMESVVLPKGCRTESNIMSPNLSVLALFPKNAYFLPVGANLPPRLIPSLLLLIQPLDFIFYKILPALSTMMTADFLFLLKAAHLFIYLLLKPLSSKLLTPPSADKNNLCTA